MSKKNNKEINKESIEAILVKSYTNIKVSKMSKKEFEELVKTQRLWIKKQMAFVRDEAVPYKYKLGLIKKQINSKDNPVTPSNIDDLYSEKSNLELEIENINNPRISHLEGLLSKINNLEDQMKHSLIMRNVKNIKKTLN